MWAVGARSTFIAPELLRLPLEGDPDASLSHRA
jgi:hypothetical protein